MKSGYMEIEKNLYCIKDSCNVYLIKKGEKAVLIDFGTGNVRKFLKEMGVRKIEAVFLTHHHRDQAEGLQDAKNQLKDMQMYAPETEYELVSEADWMWQRREIYNNYNNRQDRFSVLDSIPAKRALDYSCYHYMGMNFWILPTPGHTTGSISIVTELNGRKVAFTGDLIYAPGKVWSLAALQWSYNGGEGIPYTILSLLDLEERKIQALFPSHGEKMETKTAIGPTVEKLAELRDLREQNPRLFLLREHPYEEISKHVLFNRTSMANSYVLISKSKKALLIDFGYDFMAGMASGVDRSARRPWLYTLPSLLERADIDRIDACIPTHYHDDHVAGINLLKRVYGTKVICPEGYAEVLEHPEKYDLPCLWYDPVQVDKKVSYGTSFCWEEYEIRVWHLSGHTYYASAIEFTADGQKFLCTGDQYSGDAGTMPNYVYKNIFEARDFVESAALYQKLHPDWILSGHWQQKKPDEDFYKKLEQTGKELLELHRELLPEKEELHPINDFKVCMFPYQIEVKKKEAFDVGIHLIKAWFLVKKEETCTLELLLPEGFECEEKVQSLRYGEAETVFHVRAADCAVRRARIGCRVKAGERQWGTQAEILVTVVKEKESR